MRSLPGSDSGDLIVKIISCNNFDVQCTSNTPSSKVIIIEIHWWGHDTECGIHTGWYVGVWFCTSAPFQFWSLSNFYTHWSLLPTFQILPKLFNVSHHYLLSFGLLPVFMISPRLVFDHIDVFSLFPVLWQLLRAVKSLVMGKKTFLDPAAGKLLILTCWNCCSPSSLRLRYSWYQFYHRQISHSASASSIRQVTKIFPEWELIPPFFRAWLEHTFSSPVQYSFVSH